MSTEIKNFIIISSGMAVVSVESDIPTLLSDIQNSSFAKSYIPDVGVSTEAKQDIDAWLVIKKGGEFSVKLQYPEIICEQPENADAKGLIVLIGYILERANNEKGIYSIHSSVIVKDGRAVVIFGGTTNLGKTTIAKMASEKFGWTFYSDEIALIYSQTASVIAGGKIATNSDNFKDFELTNTNEPTKIVGFIHPHLDNGLNKVEKWNNDKFFWHLKEELSRRIRGSSKAINFFTYPLDSLDTQTVATERLSFAKKISTEIPCYEIRGTPDYVAEYIDLTFN